MVNHRGARPAQLAALLSLALAYAAAPARGDSPRLAEARRAVEAVDYDAARRLLVEALHDGDNSPAAMREIYRLSARAAVVLGERDLAEQYYRRWLAIDPDAALPADTAPKLREPFIAAEAYIAAHGRLRARARRIAGGAVDVELLSDPLAMAQAARALDAGAAGTHLARGAGAAFDADHRARLAAAARVAIVDDRRNRLLDLDVEMIDATASGPVGSAATGPGAAILTPRPPSSSPPPADAPAPSRRWLYWAIPTGVFALGATGFGIAAIASYGQAHQIADNSGRSFLSDAEDNVGRGRAFVWVTIATGAAAIACAIPAAIYFFGDRRTTSTVGVVPAVAPDRIGVALGGRF